jgi:hypothetical protein
LDSAAIEGGVGDGLAGIVAAVDSEGRSGHDVDSEWKEGM